MRHRPGRRRGVHQLREPAFDRGGLTEPVGLPVVRAGVVHPVAVQHAELLENGELGVRPLRSAEATATFILSGGKDFFEPTKTFHGFRYAEVSGLPRPLTADDLEAVVVHSGLERTGTFEWANELVNQWHHDIVWDLPGNFLELPVGQGIPETPPE